MESFQGLNSEVEVRALGARVERPGLEWVESWTLGIVSGGFRTWKNSEWRFKDLECGEVGGFRALEHWWGAGIGSGEFRAWDQGVEDRGLE